MDTHSDSKRYWEERLKHNWGLHKRDIFYENIRCFSDYAVNKRSVEELIIVFSDRFVNMSDARVLKAEDTYKNIFGHLKPELGIRIEKGGTSKTLSRNYWIAAYHYILDKKSTRARDVISLCMRTHGVTFYSLAIYLSTHLNIDTIKRLNYFRAKFIS